MQFWSGGKWVRCPPTLPSWSSLLGGGCCSVTQSYVTLQPHGLQHARPLYPSPSSGVCPSFFLCISDAVQPPHPLVPSSALNLSQHQASLQLGDILHLSFKSSWYILPHCEPSSISYSVSWNTKVLILIKSYLCIVFFVGLCFWCHIKEKIANSDMMKVHDYIPF